VKNGPRLHPSVRNAFLVHLVYHQVYAKIAKQESFKTSLAKIIAKIVARIHICRKKERLLLQIALVVPQIAPQVLASAALRVLPASANEKTTTQVLITVTVFPALLEPTVQLKMDLHCQDSRQNQGSGDQALIVTSFHHVLLGIAR
jgi:hypothetical protein